MVGKPGSKVTLAEFIIVANTRLKELRKLTLLILQSLSSTALYKSKNLKRLSLFFAALIKGYFLLYFFVFLCGIKVTICFANSELFQKQNMLHEPPFSLEIQSLLPMTNISSGAPTKISLARRSQHESTPNTLSYWDLGLSSRNSSKP